MSEEKVKEYKKRIKNFAKNTSKNIEITPTSDNLIKNSCLDIALMIAEIPEEEYIFFKTALNQLIEEGWMWYKQ